MAYVMAAAKGGSRSALGHARYFGGRGVGGASQITSRIMQMVRFLSP